MLDKFIERLVADVLAEGDSQGRGDAWAQRPSTWHALHASDHLLQFTKLQSGVPLEASADEDELTHLSHALVRILMAIHCFRNED